MRCSPPSLVRAALVGLVLALGATALDAGESPGRLRLGKPHRMKVTHTTRVKVDAGTARLIVWHAAPLRREWPGLDGPLGATEVSFRPAAAREAATRSEGGLAWKWELAEPAAGEMDFVSTFELTSFDRELRTTGLVVKWAELPAHEAEVMKGLPALPTPNERIREAAAEIRRKSKDVVAALEACAAWVSRSIAYAPGASYASDDLDAICRGAGGHCGHRATVYLALCKALGIPARRVIGYAFLNGPPGGAGTDDGNRHVWVQVSLPTLGWVEVEPAPHGSPFAIAYPFVMGPFDLQSRFLDSASKDGAPSARIVSDTLRMEERK